MAPIDRDTDGRQRTPGTAKNYISCRPRTPSSSSQRCAGLAAIDVVAGTVFCLSNAMSAVASPPGKRPKVDHASIRSERFHGGRFAAKVDEFCQDFIGFRRTGCILSKCVKGLPGQSGAALTKMSSAPASDPCAPALGASGVDREADAIRGIGRAVPHEYQGENSGLSDRPWDGAAFASPLLGG